MPHFFSIRSRGGAVGAHCWHSQPFAFFLSQRLLSLALYQLSFILPFFPEFILARSFAIPDSFHHFISLHIYIFCSIQGSRPSSIISNIQAFVVSFIRSLAYRREGTRYFCSWALTHTSVVIFFVFFRFAGTREQMAGLLPKFSGVLGLPGTLPKEGGNTTSTTKVSRPIVLGQSFITILIHLRNPQVA